MSRAFCASVFPALAYLGSVTVNVVPAPGRLARSMAPRCDSAIHFTMARPRPKPPSCTRAALVGPVKAVENVRRGFGRNAEAGIGNGDAKLRAVGFERCRNLAARRRVADGVIQQVDHQAAQQVLVAAKGNILAGAAFQLDGARRRQRLHGAAALGDQVVEIELLDAQLDVSGIGARQVEQIVHQAREAARFVQHDAERCLVFGGRALARRATSASPRIMAIGVRSSWEASATKRRMLSKDWSRRASSSLKEAARISISSAAWPISRRVSRLLPVISARLLGHPAHRRQARAMPASIRPAPPAPPAAAWRARAGGAPRKLLRHRVQVRHRQHHDALAAGGRGEHNSVFAVAPEFRQYQHTPGAGAPRARMASSSRWKIGPVEDRICPPARIATRLSIRRLTVTPRAALKASPCSSSISSPNMTAAVLAWEASVSSSWFNNAC